MATMLAYPNCSACGHSASGVAAGRCTAFVPYPEGDPRGLAGYCPCHCIDDPAIQEWLGPEQVASLRKWLPGGGTRKDSGND